MVGALKKGDVLRNGKLPYVIEKVLGVGGFGITYKVSVTTREGGVATRHFFAVKEHFVKEWCVRDEATLQVLHSKMVKQFVEDSKADFLAEARRLSQLRHPNIIKVYEQFEENNTAYYVMEYLEGENLRDYVMAKGEMPSSFMINLFTPICKAVKALHEKNMTHLDIKPANIMIRRKAKGIMPVLIDFGLSKHYNDEGQVTSTIRTQGCSDGYAPIEQYAGISKFSPQSDIYSLAATMLFCLSCKRPPKANDVTKSTIFNMLPSVTPENVKSAIVHAMSPSRGIRTESVDQLLKELKQGPSAIVPRKRVVTSPNENTYHSSSRIEEYEEESSSNWGCWFFFIILIILAMLGGWYYYNKEMKPQYYERDTTPGYSTNVPGFQNEKIEVIDSHSNE